MGYRGNDRFSTDPTGRLAAGAPSGGLGGPQVSVGRVGNPIPSAVFPGRTAGTAPGVSIGFGGRGGVPMTPKDTAGAVKKKAKGGSVKKMAKGGSTASKRADGCATKGKTKGRFV